MIDELLSKNLFLALKARKKKVVFAESLTGGLISAELTKYAGASEVFWGGFVTYSVEAKKRILFVKSEIIKKYGTVSIRTAEAMAEGALKAAFSENDFPHYAVAVTGMASPPAKDSAEKNIPTGTVCISAAAAGSFHKNKFSLQGNYIPSLLNIITETKEFKFSGDRESVRLQTVNAAFSLLLGLLDR